LIPPGSREREASQPRTPLLLLPDLLRNGIACLALALGFAALAVRPGSDDSLLQECQEGWGYWQWRQRDGRASRRGDTSDEEYFRQIQGDRDHPDDLLR